MVFLSPFDIEGKNVWVYARWDSHADPCSGFTCGVPLSSFDMEGIHGYVEIEVFMWINIPVVLSV